MADQPPVAVNARFQGRPVTGVERYASELMARLVARDDEAVEALAPRTPTRGLRAHAWEQLALPSMFRRSGARLLLSLCNTGPVAVAEQLVVIHDVAPFLHPDSFTRAYGLQVRTVQRLLARRCAVATVSQRSRKDLSRVLRLDPERIAVVPCAVGPPFRHDQPGEGGARCVFVGGHDRRKNLEFLLALWPEVQHATGLELHIVARSDSATLRSSASTATPGVAWHLDPDDAALASLYRGALCLLAPSRYEGFGLPLLEAMACGTPFLATDTGAARELAADAAEQVLPLDADLWISRLVSWSYDDPLPRRQANLQHAADWTWERSAEQLVAAVADASAR